MTPIGLAPPPHETDLHEPASAELVPEARPIVPLPARRRSPERFFGRPLWISVGAHALLLAALLLYLRFGPEMTPLGRPATEQTVQYVDLVLPSEAEAEAVEAEQAPVDAASAASSPDPPSAAPRSQGAAPEVITSQGGNEPMPPPAASGGPGVAERLRPGFSDPRLYADPEINRMRQPPVSDVERYRRHFQARIDALNDSMYGGGPNTDWTVKDGSGNRWGISEDGLHLGPLTVPRALVPFPAATGTNQDLEEAREQRRQREEIDRQEADRAVRKAREESAAAARARREQ